jgi:hypothetical protein
VRKIDGEGKKGEHRSRRGFKEDRYVRRLKGDQKA